MMRACAVAVMVLAISTARAAPDLAAQSRTVAEAQVNLDAARRARGLNPLLGFGIFLVVVGIPLTIGGIVFTATGGGSFLPDRRAGAGLLVGGLLPTAGGAAMIHFGMKNYRRDTERVRVAELELANVLRVEPAR